jgi:hypothetical protein
MLGLRGKVGKQEEEVCKENYSYCLEIALWLNFCPFFSFPERIIFLGECIKEKEL